MTGQPLGGGGRRAVAVLARGPKLLVVTGRRDGRAYAELPGVEAGPGEAVGAAAVRALAEECSMTGTPGEVLLDRDDAGRATSYVAVTAEGEPSASRGDRTHLWATAGELPLLGLVPEGLGVALAEAVWPLRVDVAEHGDGPVLERLWQLYCHDLSEFRHSAPEASGEFVAARLRAYQRQDDRVCYLARLGEVPCGFALVRLGSAAEPRTMGEFFVTRSTRGRGAAAALARDVLGRHPGRWVVAFQNENPRAASFWRRLAASELVDVTERTLPVPGKPHLPPDVWLHGSTRRDR